MIKGPRFSALALATAAALAAPAYAEPLVGLTSTNALVTFDSATPLSGSSLLNITGLQTNERILGIDYRPTTNILYGLGSMNRLYTLNATTGAASFVALLTADPTDLTNPFTALSGRSFGIDFNPVPDLAGMPSLRITSNAGENLRVNVNAGSLGRTFTDTNLNPGSPTIVASAYINNDTNPATGTTLYAIDSATDALYTQNPANDGTLQLVGALGFDTSGVSGFDVSPSGIAYASFTDALTSKSGLYRINLTTGAATLLGAFGIGGNTAIAPPLLGLAAPVPEPGTYALMLAGLLGVGWIAKRRSSV